MRRVFTTKISILEITDFFMWLFFFLTFIVAIINNSTVIFRIRFITLLVAGLLGLFQLTRQSSFNKRLVLYIYISIVSCLVSYLLNGTNAYPLNMLIYAVFYMGIAVNLISHKQKLWYAKILFHIVSLSILAKFLIYKIPLQEIMVDTESYSFNFISVFVLFYVLYYSICCIQNNKSIPFLVGVIFVVICLLAHGRGGIVTSVFYFLSLGFIGWKDKINQNKKWKKVLLLVLITVITLFILYIYVSDFLTFQSIFARFYAKSVENEPRFLIWGTYIKECISGFSNLCFGADPIPVFPPDGNLHNTFLQLHSRYGLIIAFTLIFSFYRLLIYATKEKHFYLLSVLMTLIIRAMTDKIAFHGFCEPLFYYFLFSWFNIVEKGRLISSEV